MWYRNSFFFHFSMEETTQEFFYFGLSVCLCRKIIQNSCPTRIGLQKFFDNYSASLKLHSVFLRTGINVFKISQSLHFYNIFDRGTKNLRAFTATMMVCMVPVVLPRSFAACRNSEVLVNL